MPHELSALLACPSCRGELRGWREDASDYEIACTGCGARYGVRGGIPILLTPETGASGAHDEMEHLLHAHTKADGHKARQASFFDREVAEEFEITRPHGAPAAYGWTLEEKFRRSVAELREVRGATIVDACCGSGMDAEMLAQAGARVIAVDLSEGCARRAAERAKRRGVDYTVVVGDVERLPLRDASVELSYVHDGLHHLADPMRGVRELARVARRGVSINEPAEAAGTRVAVRLGLSIDYEGAGNRVARLRAKDVAGVLRSAGFESRVRRYALYYRHEPGAIMRAASLPVMSAAYRAGVRGANAVMGRWGNKLQVTGLREAA